MKQKTEIEISPAAVRDALVLLACLLIFVGTCALFGWPVACVVLGALLLFVVFVFTRAKS